MDLAYSTNAYTRWTLSDALTSIAGLGFSHAEILCDRPHWFAVDVDAAAAECMTSLLARLDLGVANLNLNTANGYCYSPTGMQAFLRE